MNFADRLRQERLQRGISQEALAETLGVSPRTISRWEQGQAVPQAILRVKLSNFFDLPPETLFEEPEPIIPRLQSNEHTSDGLYNDLIQAEDAPAENIQEDLIASTPLPQKSATDEAVSRRLLSRRNILIGSGTLGVIAAGGTGIGILWHALSSSAPVHRASSTAPLPQQMLQSQLIHHLVDPNISNWVNHMAWSPDGSILAVATGSNVVTFWNIEKEAILLAYPTPDKWVNDVVWSKSNLIAAVTADMHAGSLEIWKFPEQTPVFTLQRNYALRSVDWSPNGKYIAMSGHSPFVEVWDPFNASQVSQYNDTTLGLLGITRVKWSPSGEFIACATDDGTIHVCEALTGTLKIIYHGHQSRIHDLSWSPDGRSIASASADTTSHVWDVSSGRTLLVYRGQTGEIEGINWSPLATCIASASADRTVHIWNASTGKSIAIYRDYKSIVEAPLWSANGTMLATGTDDEGVKIWQVPRF